MTLTEGRGGESRSSLDLYAEDLDELWTYLNLEAELIGGIHKSSTLAYVSPSDFIRQEGESFWRLSEVPEEWRGKPKECFKNAFHLALEYPKLTYIEGYASSIIAMPHAWCVNSYNEVIDPTWISPGKAYFGVRFSRGEMIKTVTTSGSYGLIDDWENGFPLLQKRRKR